jgi:hypothetical protein
MICTSYRLHITHDLRLIPKYRYGEFISLSSPKTGQSHKNCYKLTPKNDQAYIVLFTSTRDF